EWMCTLPVYPLQGQHHPLPRPYTLVCGKNDPQAVHGVLHVIGQVRVLADRVEPELLLAVTQRLMIGLVRRVDELVLLRELSCRRRRAVMKADAVGLRVAVD